MFPRLDLNSIANAAPNLIGQLANEWPVNPELLPDLAVLGLYDIIIFIGKQIACNTILKA